MKKYFKILVLVIFALSGVFFYLLSPDIINFSEKPRTNISQEQTQPDKEDGLQNAPAISTADTSANSKSNETPPIAEADPTPKKNILFDVPFTSQAPFGEWKEPAQHDGCEEASALMAVRWARGEGLTKEEAKQEIIIASNYEKQQIGEFRDASLNDTAEIIIKGYFQYPGVKVKNVVSATDMVHELENGNLVIVPANGRALGNPNYTVPGPERHMLVIRGYDYALKEFITNDSGTRKGEGYRYPESIVFNAIRDYLTGYNLPIEEIKKRMIVIRPNDI